jgi:hypothetical protein
VEETVSLVAKQQRVRARGIATRSDVGPILAPKAPVLVPSTSRINKVVPEDTLEDLIKGFKDLKVELTALRRNQGPGLSRRRFQTDGQTDGRTSGRSDDGRGGVRDLDAL